MRRSSLQVRKRGNPLGKKWRNQAESGIEWESAREPTERGNPAVPAGVYDQYCAPGVLGNSTLSDARLLMGDLSSGLPSTPYRTRLMRDSCSFSHRPISRRGRVVPSAGTNRAIVCGQVPNKHGFLKCGRNGAPFGARNGLTRRGGIGYAPIGGAASFAHAWSGRKGG